MSLTEVEVHFKEMEQLSDEIAQIAQKLQKSVVGEGMVAVSGVKEVWKSENADVFIGKGIKRLEALQQRAENLRELSADIHKRASQIYAVEMQNELSAITRRYF